MCLAIPAQVVQIVDAAEELAEVEVAGVRREVSVGLLGVERAEGLLGEWVLVHAGFAIARVDEREAATTLQLLARMGDEYERELAEMAGGTRL